MLDIWSSCKLTYGTQTPPRATLPLNNFLFDFLGQSSWVNKKRRSERSILWEQMTFMERTVHWRISSRQLAPQFPLYRTLGSRGKTHNLLATSAHKAWNVATCALTAESTTIRYKRERIEVTRHCYSAMFHKSRFCAVLMLGFSFSGSVGASDSPRLWKMTTRTCTFEDWRPSKHTNNVVKGEHNNELIVLWECHNECESHCAVCF